MPQHRTTPYYRRALTFALSASLLVSTLSACNSEAFERGRAAGQADAQAIASTATPTPTPQTRALTGSGKKVEGPFPLQSGLVRVAMKYEGERNFIVRLLDDQGQSAAGLDSLLANSVGAWQGEKALRVEKSGQYVLDVTSEGAWEIAITQ